MSGKEKKIEVLTVYCKTGNAKEPSSVEAIVIEANYVQKNKKGGPPRLTIIESINKKEALKTKKLFEEIKNSREKEGIFEQSRRITINENTGEVCSLFELLGEKKRWEQFANDEIEEPGKAFEHTLPKPFDKEPILGKVAVFVYMKPSDKSDEDQKKGYTLPSKRGGQNILNILKKKTLEEAEIVAEVDETNPIKRLCELESEMVNKDKEVGSSVKKAKRSRPTKTNKKVKEDKTKRKKVSKKNKKV